MMIEIDCGVHFTDYHVRNIGRLCRRAGEDNVWQCKGTVKLNRCIRLQDQLVASFHIEGRQLTAVDAVQFYVLVLQVVH